MSDNSFINEILESFKADLKKANDFLNGEYLTIRAGRANTHILDKVGVQYYGVQTPISQMANISVPEARMIVISVWDQSQIANVSKAIIQADLGVMPSDDGRVIRLVFPQLTEDRRKEIVKQVKKMCEDCKVTMRNSRRECLDMFKQMKKDGELTEDEIAGLDKDVQKILDSFISTTDNLASLKEKEIMEI